MIKTECFLFAVICIQLVFFLKVNLYFLDDEEENILLQKQHRLETIKIPQFKNFIKRQFLDENYFYEILAQSLIKIHSEYTKQYDPKKRELNFLLFEGIIVSCFKDYIYKELNKE